MLERDQITVPSRRDERPTSVRTSIAFGTPQRLAFRGVGAARLARLFFDVDYSAAAASRRSQEISSPVVQGVGEFGQAWIEASPDQFSLTGSVATAAAVAEAAQKTNPLGSNLAVKEAMIVLADGTLRWPPARAVWASTRTAACMPCRGAVCSSADRRENSWRSALQKQINANRAGSDPPPRLCPLHPAAALQRIIIHRRRCFPSGKGFVRRQLAP